MSQNFLIEKIIDNNETNILYLLEEIHHLIITYDIQNAIFTTNKNKNKKEALTEHKTNITIELFDDDKNNVKLNCSNYIAGSFGLNYIYCKNYLEKINIEHKNIANNKTEMNQLIQINNLSIMTYEHFKNNYNESLWLKARSKNIDELFKSLDYDIHIFCFDDKNIDYSLKENIDNVKKFLSVYTKNIKNSVEQIYKKYIYDTDLFNNSTNNNNNNNNLFNMLIDNTNNNNNNIRNIKEYNNVFVNNFIRNEKNYNENLFNITEDDNIINSNRTNINHNKNLIGGTETFIDKILEMNNYKIVISDDGNIFDNVEITNKNNITTNRILYKIKNMKTNAIINIYLFDIIFEPYFITKPTKPTISMNIEKSIKLNIETNYNYLTPIIFDNTETIFGYNKIILFNSILNLINNYNFLLKLSNYHNKTKIIFKMLIILNVLKNPQLQSLSTISLLEKEENRKILINLLQDYKKIINDNQIEFKILVERLNINIQTDFKSQKIKKIVYGMISSTINDNLINIDEIIQMYGDENNYDNILKLQNNNKEKNYIKKVLFTDETINQLIKKYFDPKSEYKLNINLIKSLNNIHQIDILKKIVEIFKKGSDNEKRSYEFITTNQQYNNVIQKYTGMYYNQINKGINKYINGNSKINDDEIIWINDLLKCINSIDNKIDDDGYIAVLSSRPLMLYYGQKKISLSNFNKGETYIIPNFISCTYDIKIAEKFNKTLGYVLLLFIKINGQYLNVSNTSVHNKESEILLAPGKIIALEKITFENEDQSGNIIFQNLLICIYEECDNFLNFTLDDPKPIDEFKNFFDSYIHCLNIKNIICDKNVIISNNNVGFGKIFDLPNLMKYDEIMKCDDLIKLFININPLINSFSIKSNKIFTSPIINKDFVFYSIKNKIIMYSGRNITNLYNEQHIYMTDYYNAWYYGTILHDNSNYDIIPYLIDGTTEELIFFDLFNEININNIFNNINLFSDDQIKNLNNYYLKYRTNELTSSFFFNGLCTEIIFNNIKYGGTDGYSKYSHNTNDDIQVFNDIINIFGFKNLVHGYICRSTYSFEHKGFSFTDELAFINTKKLFDSKQLIPIKNSIISNKFLSNNINLKIYSTIISLYFLHNKKKITRTYDTFQTDFVFSKYLNINDYWIYKHFDELNNYIITYMNLKNLDIFDYNSWKICDYDDHNINDSFDYSKKYLKYKKKYLELKSKLYNTN